MGQLPGRIHGTSKLPVASLQASQATQVQDIIRHELKLGSTPLGNPVFTNFSSFVGSPIDRGNHQEDERGLSCGKQPESKSRKTHTTKRGSCTGSSPSAAKGACTYSLKQLKDFISDIYLQKIKNDDRCVN